ncbi:MAG: hypothetical protein AMXMBFR83_20560 [Phycisphaerae bacterium]
MTSVPSTRRELSTQGRIRALAERVQSLRREVLGALNDPIRSQVVRQDWQDQQKRLGCELSAEAFADVAAHVALCRTLEEPGGASLARAPADHHLYEAVLAALDGHQRRRRGVFYTPTPVAAFIVRAAHETLQRELGLADGLADVTPWEEMARRHPGLAVPAGVDPAEPFVRILDPAAGSGVFLIEVIELIRRVLSDQWRRQGDGPGRIARKWVEYVPRFLLPRLHGRELLPAACAVARLLIERKLGATGYALKAGDVLHVTAGNSLHRRHEPGRPDGGDAGDGAFTVIVGNPPYAARSGNDHAWTGPLLADYKAGLNETNLNALSDDYVKFFRLAHDRVLRAGAGVIGLVTNHSFLEGLTHRRMRELLARDFQRIRVVNLHGCLMRRGELPAGRGDENVFDIRQGVAVTLLTRPPSAAKADSAVDPAFHGCAAIDYCELIGGRAGKFQALQRGCDGLRWRSLPPAPPRYLFRPAPSSGSNEYLRWPSLAEVFEVFSSGIKFRRDGLLVKNHFTPADVERMLAEVASLPDADLSARYGFREAPDWRLADLRPLFAVHRPEDVVEVLYRPFDVRHAFYPLDRIGRIVPRGDSRIGLMVHMLRGPNVGLLFNRQVVGRAVSHFLVSRRPVSHGTFYLGNRGQDYFAPLYRYEPAGRVPNFSAAWLGRLADAIGSPRPVAPEAALHYLYAVVHSPTYRSRYDVQLRADFPRVPWPATRELFERLSVPGAELAGMHLLEDHPPWTAHFLPRAGGESEEFFSHSPRIGLFGSTTVAAGFPKYTGGRVYLNPDGWFEGIPEPVWAFEVGGYQVAHKWLAARRGRTLTREDARTYGRVVSALMQTLERMKQIDAIIAGAGGWPGAFETTRSTTER